MLLYHSVNDVVVHRHFVDMDGCLRVWLSLGCGIWKCLGKASSCWIVLQQHLLPSEWLKSRTRFRTSTCKLMLFVT